MVHAIVFPLSLETAITCAESLPCTLSAMSMRARTIRGALRTRLSCPFSGNRLGLCAHHRLCTDEDTRIVVEHGMPMGQQRCFDRPGAGVAFGCAGRCSRAGRES